MVAMNRVAICPCTGEPVPLKCYVSRVRIVVPGIENWKNHQAGVIRHMYEGGWIREYNYRN